MDPSANRKAAASDRRIAIVEQKVRQKPRGCYASKIMNLQSKLFRSAGMLTAL